ncbi:MAG: hypothetical protein ACOX58_00570 [Christensenellales bacterium]|jgi:hypothetical protein
MIDLNSTLFYKTNFFLQGDADVLWEVISAIRYWLIRKYNQCGMIIKEDFREWTWMKKDEFNRNLSNDPGKVYIESCNHYGFQSERHYWACRIVETNIPSDAGIAPRKWTTDIGLNLLSEEKGELSFVVSYSDAAGYIGFRQPEPDISTHGIIRMLVDHRAIEAVSGQDRIIDFPIKLNPGDFPDFWIDVLSDERELPIILMSPDKVELNNGVFVVSPVDLAQALIGNAKVYYSDSYSFFEEMDFFLPYQYRCKNGAIRIYYAPCNPRVPDDYTKHRFISSVDVHKWGKEDVIAVLRRALCQDIHFYDSKKFIRIETCKDLNEENSYQQRLAHTSEDADKQVEIAKRKAEQSIEQVLEEAITLEGKLQEAESEIRAKERENSELKQEKHDLSQRLTACMPIVERVGSVENSIGNLRKFSEYPDSAVEIAKMICCIHPDTIDFTEKGFKSLEECDKDPSVVWQALWNSATILREIYMTQSGDIEKIFDDQVSGFTLARGHGKATRKDASLMRQYMDYYEEEEISIEAHIRRGNSDRDLKSIRLYFYFCPKRNKIIIGYIGNHLENYSSRKVK